MQMTHSSRLFALMLAAAGSLAAQGLVVVNSASFTGSAIAPGAIVTLFGSNLSTGTASVADPAHPPTTLGGTQVTIGGAAATLFYVSSTQINAVVNPATPVGTDTVVVTSATGTVTGSVVVDVNASPGLFSLTGTGTHDGAIVDALTGKTGAFRATTPIFTSFLSIYLTGANLSTTPVVSVGGVSVPVTFAGPSPCCAGLQQINVSLPASLAGAGRVPLVVKAGASLSNVVEVVLLPAKGKGEFDDEGDDQDRSRELSAIAWIPGTSLALIADENDDVLREVDIAQKKVIRVISLASDSEPAAIAINSSGTIALVAERGRAKVAVVDLATFTVKNEIAVGFGPVAVSISGSLAVVVNGDGGTVTILNLSTNAVVATVSTGLGARGVAIDASNRAYITNQTASTVTVIDLATAKVINTIDLGATRPAGIQLLGSTGFAVITDPVTAANGKVLVVNLATGVTTTLSVNPAGTGGSGDVAVVGSTVYIANQAAGSISILPLTVSGSQVTGTATTLAIGQGVRALAVDTKDGLLLALNTSTGEVVLVSLASNQIVGRITAVTGVSTDDDGDNHNDRGEGANLPTLASVSPATVRVNTTFTLTLGGTNLQGATDVSFLLPGKFPGNSENKGKGGGLLKQAKDSSFTVSNVQVNAAGTQLTATVTVSKQADTGSRLVVVGTPNGESTFVLSAKDSLAVTP